MRIMDKSIRPIIGILLCGVMFLIGLENLSAIPIKQSAFIKAEYPIVKYGFINKTDLFYTVSSTQINEFHLNLYKYDSGELVTEKEIPFDSLLFINGSKNGDIYEIILTYSLYDYFPYIYDVWKITSQGKEVDSAYIGCNSLLSEISNNGRYIIWGEGADAGEGAGETLFYDSHSRSLSKICDEMASSGACIYSINKMKVAVADNETKTIGYYEKRKNQWVKLYQSKPLPWDSISKLRYLSRYNKILAMDMNGKYQILDTQGKMLQSYSEGLFNFDLPFPIKEPYLFTDGRLILFDNKGLIKSLFNLSDIAPLVKKELEKGTHLKGPYEISYSEDLFYLVIFEKDENKFTFYKTIWVNLGNQGRVRNRH